MKRYFLFFLFLSTVCVGAFAQKVSYKKETIYVDNEPYAMLLKKGNALVKNYSLQTMDGKEIFYAKYMEGASGLARIGDVVGNTTNSDMYYEITFVESGERAIFDDINSFKVGEAIAKEVVENNLIVNGALNPEGLRRFLMIYKPREVQTQPDVVIINQAGGTTSEANYALVERNQNARVSIFSERIEQDFKTVGTFTEEKQLSQGKTFSKMQFLLPDGMKVAETTFETFAKETVANVVTVRDGKTHSVRVGFQASDSPQLVIARYLIERRYL